MDCIQTQKLLSEYSVDWISGKLKAEIEAHLDSCPACSVELAKLERVMSLVNDLDIMEPPVGLWNGVYNRITATESKPERVSPWQNVRNLLRLKTTQWSVGFATLALAAVLTFSHVHSPAHNSAGAYAANDYIENHIMYTSQDVLADQAAVNSYVALDDREESGAQVL